MLCSGNGRAYLCHHARRIKSPAVFRYGSSRGDSPLVGSNKLLDKTDIATAQGSGVVVRCDDPEELWHTMGPVADAPATKEGVLAGFGGVCGVGRCGGSRGPLQTGRVRKEGAVGSAVASKHLHILPAWLLSVEVVTEGDVRTRLTGIGGRLAHDDGPIKRGSEVGIEGGAIEVEAAGGSGVGDEDNIVLAGANVVALGVEVCKAGRCAAEQSGPQAKLWKLCGGGIGGGSRSWCGRGDEGEDKSGEDGEVHNDASEYVTFLFYRR